MARDLNALKAHLNITGTLDAVDAVVLPALLSAADSKVTADLGNCWGTSSDVDLAGLMLAAHWYENREATISGTIIATLPLGVEAIIDNYRNYTFGLVDDGE